MRKILIKLYTREMLLIPIVPNHDSLKRKKRTTTYERPSSPRVEIVWEQEADYEIVWI